MERKKAEISVKGRPVRVDSLQVDRHNLIITGKFVKTARTDQEWYEDVEDPESIIRILKDANPKPDIFTFWQRYPETHPKYNYYMEMEPIAVLPIKGFDYWYAKQIDTNARRAVKKAEKRGVHIKPVEFDDDFIRGIVAIFNETPFRQGRPFWHYGKDFETVKREFSRFIFREDLLGAYFNGELVGFMFLANAGKYVLPGQIISQIKHRDKALNNALIAKAVEICEKKRIPYFIYYNWGDSTLAEFKRRNGFQKADLPRYYIALTTWGKIVLKLRLHRGIVGVLPQKMILILKKLRKHLYEIKYS
jgi:hypothetical protein